MSIRPLYKKLGLVKGMSIFLHAAPGIYFDILEVQREAYEKKDKPSIQSVDFVHAFLKNREAMMRDAYYLKLLLLKIGILCGLTSLNESRFNTLERYYRISMSYRLGKRKKKEGIQF